MPSARWHAAQVANSVLKQRTCRVSAGAQRPRSIRNLHCSAIVQQKPNDPADPNKSGTSPADSNTEDEPKNPNPAPSAKDEASPKPQSDAQNAARREAHSSFSRRTHRHRRNSDSAVMSQKRETKTSPRLPEFEVPNWFLERNVKHPKAAPTSELKLSGSPTPWPFHIALPPRSQLQRIWESSRNMKIDGHGGASSTDAATHLGKSDVTGNLSALEKVIEIVARQRTLVEEAMAGMGKMEVVGMQLARTEELLAACTTLRNFISRGKSDDSKIESTQEVIDFLEKFGTEQESMLRPRREPYELSSAVFAEVVTALRAALAIKAPRGLDKDAIYRPDTVLHSPNDSCHRFLEVVVEAAADFANADVFHIDAEDFLEVVSGYLGESVAWTGDNISSLVFSVHEEAGKGEKIEEDSGNADERSGQAELPSELSAISNVVRVAVERASPRQSDSEQPEDYGISADELTQGLSEMTEEEKVLNSKISRAINAILDAAISKGTAHSTYSHKQGVSSTSNAANGFFIHIKGYKEIMATEHGEAILEKFRDAITERWIKGTKIALVGTTCMPIAEDGKTISRKDIRLLQSEVQSRAMNTIFIPSSSSPSQRLLYLQDEAARIRQLNVRHLQQTVKSLLSGSGIAISPDAIENVITILSKKPHTVKDITEHVWGYSRVYRTALGIIGSSLDLEQGLETADVWNGLGNMAASDSYKLDWAELGSGKTRKSSWSERMQTILKRCNAYELKLRGGLIDPSNVDTKFSDVHVPKTAIEALQTLTTLTFKRPDAFTYGVLAKEKIRGVLLYGPPGTGKTLLAKALAKDSNVTMLEVSGAEIHSKWVGDAEKNVKAIFSLAKKLSPCVVFLDEADALLAARGGDASSGGHLSHRHTINQFLKEWDGMTDTKAFIMLATNRPFDLDEAVLRRVPRRLLIDLPSEKDRVAILKIHLHGEQLDESVDLGKIARDTPFYSGSDLKNLCVAAALECVKEETVTMEAARQAREKASDVDETIESLDDEENFRFPPRRTLSAKHFTEAMQQISASSAEDTRAVEAIRKFDEKYGDRRGRRKKRSSLGFASIAELERDSEAARVRKIATGE